MLLLKARSLFGAREKSLATECGAGSCQAASEAATSFSALRLIWHPLWGCTGSGPAL